LRYPNPRATPVIVYQDQWEGKFAGLGDLEVIRRNIELEGGYTGIHGAPRIASKKAPVSIASVTESIYPKLPFGRGSSSSQESEVAATQANPPRQARPLNGRYGVTESVLFDSAEEEDLPRGSSAEVQINENPPVEATMRQTGKNGTIDVGSWAKVARRSNVIRVPDTSDDQDGGSDTAGRRNVTGAQRSEDEDDISASDDIGTPTPVAFGSAELRSSPEMSPLDTGRSVQHRHSNDPLPELEHSVRRVGEATNKGLATEQSQKTPREKFRESMRAWRLQDEPTDLPPLLNLDNDMVNSDFAPNSDFDNSDFAHSPKNKDARWNISVASVHSDAEGSENEYDVPSSPPRSGSPCSLLSFESGLPDELEDEGDAGSIDSAPSPQAMRRVHDIIGSMEDDVLEDNKDDDEVQNDEPEVTTSQAEQEAERGERKADGYGVWYSYSSDAQEEPVGDEKMEEDTQGRGKATIEIKNPTNAEVEKEEIRMGRSVCSDMYDDEDLRSVDGDAISDGTGGSGESTGSVQVKLEDEDKDEDEAMDEHEPMDDKPSPTNLGGPLRAEDSSDDEKEEMKPTITPPRAPTNTVGSVMLCFFAWCGIANMTQGSNNQSR
jgi:hypothetical protein